MYFEIIGPLKKKRDNITCGVNLNDSCNLVSANTLCIKSVVNKRDLVNVLCNEFSQTQLFLPFTMH